MRAMNGVSLPAAQDPFRQYDGALRSQLVTSKRGGRRTLPYAFTEHGAITVATVLDSPRAVSMSCTSSAPSSKCASK